MSSDDIAIRVSNLSKRYEIYNKPGDRLKQFIIPKLCRILPVLKRFFATRIDSQGNPVFFNEFWALKDVSFEIKKGETVGIIGRNGSGKSTLLQLICGTLNPTAGEIKVNGRIAALLELGAGFNPEFTGRENVRMSCALLGMTAEETEAHFDEIAAFADIGEFIEQPVKTYSSGMFVRLAFAVNIVSKPDIMIVDEALAVGDMNFQAKCMTALKRMQHLGTTVLFVSHDINAVKSLCSRAIYLDNGEMQAFDSASDVASKYLQVMREEMNKQTAKSEYSHVSSEVISKELTEQNILNVEDLKFRKCEKFANRVQQFRYGSGGAKIVYAEMLNLNSQSIVIAEFGQKVCIQIHIETYSELVVSCNYMIADNKKNFIVGCDPRLINKEYLKSKFGGKYIISYTTNLPLKEGNYSVDLELTRPIIVDEIADYLDVVPDAITFSVERKPNGRVWAQFFLQNEYECHEIL